MLFGNPKNTNYIWFKNKNLLKFWQKLKEKPKSRT